MGAVGNPSNLDELIRAIEDQARSVLRLLDHPRTSGTHIPADPLACPNCGKRVESLRSPYCGEVCKEIAGFVRQYRSFLRDGHRDDRDRQIALGQTLWHLLGGGRPLRRAMIPTRDVDKVVRREGGLCQQCGKDATTVDHALTGCNRIINLRAVCDDCNRDRPFFAPETMERPEFNQLLAEIAGRIRAVDAVRCCDDAETWDWRYFLAERRSRFGQ